MNEPFTFAEVARHVYDRLTARSTAMEAAIGDAGLYKQLDRDVDSIMLGASELKDVAAQRGDRALAGLIDDLTYAAQHIGMRVFVNSQSAPAEEKAVLDAAGQDRRFRGAARGNRRPGRRP